MENKPQSPDARAKLNRIAGLSSYALGVVILGAMAFSIYDAGGIKNDYYNYGIGLAAAIIAIAIGYTTGRRS